MGLHLGNTNEMLFHDFMVISGKGNLISLFSVSISHVAEKQNLKFLLRIKITAVFSQLRHLTSHTTGARGFQQLCFKQKPMIADHMI